MNVQDSRGRIRWVRLVLVFTAFLLVSIGLGYLIRVALVRFHIPTDLPLWLGLLIIFFVLMIINVSFIIPIPFGVSLMLAASTQYNPILVALAGATGASLGEFGGYLFGAIGKKVAIHENTPGFKMVQNWIKRYGMWAIAFISFQPIIPFELGGFTAGLVRMPVKQFLPAVALGRFPKYLILIYAGTAILRFFPGFTP
jgi:membrane protein YqaA with SNARE-associated domain